MSAMALASITKPVDQHPTHDTNIILSDEQQIAFDLFKKGKNVFLSGPGGSGKSCLIKEMVNYCRERGVRVDVCALTGCAALLLEGCKAKTIHSWAGIGLANGPIEETAKRLAKHKRKGENWKTVHVLIVDEVSMMSKKLFELLNLCGKMVRKSELPFGGIQLVFSGDFFQLPPVPSRDQEDTDKFCFESPQWYEVFPKVNHVLLKKIFRQDNALFSKILNQIRVGKISKNSCAELKTHVGKKKSEEMKVRPTLLYPRRHQVEKTNERELNALDGEEHIYNMSRVPESDALMEIFTPVEREICKKALPQEKENEYLFLKKGANCDSRIVLKLGAQVMCTVNLEMDSEKPICNGSQGIVVDFTSDGFPVVEFYNGVRRKMGKHKWKSEKIPSVQVGQVPLMLAWALTIHKCQGATLDIAEMDLGNRIFECGQTYVALSRVRSLDGLYLKSFDPYKIRVNSKVIKFYDKL